MLTKDSRKELTNIIFEIAVGKQSFDTKVYPLLLNIGLSELQIMFLKSKDKISSLTDDILYSVAEIIDKYYDYNLITKYFKGIIPSKINQKGIVFYDVQKIGNVYMGMINSVQLSLYISQGDISTILPIDRIKLLNSNIIVNRFINGIKLTYDYRLEDKYIDYNPSTKTLTYNSSLYLPYDSLITVLNILSVTGTGNFNIPIWLVSDNKNLTSSYHMLYKIQDFVKQELGTRINEDLFNDYPFESDVLLNYLSNNYTDFETACAEMSIMLLKTIHFCKEHKCTHLIPLLRIKHLNWIKQGHIEKILSIKG